VALGIPDAGGSARKGALMLVNATALATLRGEICVDELNATATVHGVEQHGRLGETLLWTAPAAHGGGARGLLATAPLTNGAGRKPTFEERERGRLYYWHGAALPSGKTTVDGATWATMGERGRGRFGASLADYQRPSAPNETCLLVGSPRASAHTPYAMEGNGAVDVLCI